MERQELKKVLIEQNTEDNKEKLIQREIELKLNFDNPYVTIISGIRRSGKSTFMKQIWKKKDGYYINFDDERFFNFSISDFQKLNEILIELFGLKNNYFFDEIQNINGWERFIRRLHDTGKKIYITGSNASMLSKELGTHLTGRYIMVKIFPFSFKEFLKFKEYDIGDPNLYSTEKIGEIKNLFNEYVFKGGFPEFLKTENKDYIKYLYENLIYRDIITRHKLTNEKAIKETSLYTASNIAKEISFNQIRKITGLSSATTIKEYFSYMENCYLAFLVNKYDPSLKKQIYANKKVYFIDPAIINILGFRADRDIGRILENIVFIELLRRGKEVYYHKEKNECDFLIREGISITEAIQVTLELTEENREREINGIKEVFNKYKLNKGLILTENDDFSFNNIRVLPIWKWLISEN